MLCGPGAFAQSVAGLGAISGSVHDASGAAVWLWDTQTFGTNAPDQDPDGDFVQFVLGTRFQGQYYDAETATNYNHFRDYDLSAGRYIESDPIGLVGGLNTYSYVSANPILYIDSSGLAEHTNNARQSTLNKHQEGQARKQRDYGGEKGDLRRPQYPRKPPPNWKGSWPPKCKGLVTVGALETLDIWLLGIIPTETACPDYECAPDTQPRIWCQYYPDGHYACEGNWDYPDW